LHFLFTRTACAVRYEWNCGSSYTLYELRFSCQGAGGETKPAGLAGGNTFWRLRVWLRDACSFRSRMAHPATATRSRPEPDQYIRVVLPCQGRDPDPNGPGDCFQPVGFRPTRVNATVRLRPCQGQFPLLAISTVSPLRALSYTSIVFAVGMVHFEGR
jgi:hypothetical protein